MRTPLGPSRTSKSLDRTVSTSDVLAVAARHARVGLLPPDALPLSARRLLDRAPADLSADGALPANLRISPRPAGESKTRVDPRTPSVVSRACEPKPTSRAHVDQGELEPRACAPFHRLSTRAPRQAVLRASFRLAPHSSSWPCDPEVRETRDASDRRLPPIRTACTRTSLAPGSLRSSRCVEVPRSLGSAGHDRGPGCFTTPSIASVGRRRTRSSRPGFARVARAWAFSSHDAR